MDLKKRMQVVLEALAGDSTDVAMRHGVTQAEVDRWTADFLHASRPRKTPKLWAATAFAACLGASVAWSQAAAFPITLITFTGNTPAVASQVNSNFSALKNATDTLKTSVEGKIGTIATAGVQAKSLSVSGASSLTGATSIGGNATVAGTLSAGGATTLNASTTVNGNLTVSGEVTSSQRYVVSAPYNPAYSAQGRTSSTAPVDLTKLSALCGDYDGCTIRLVMKDWGGGGQDISAPPQHFEYQRPLFLTSFDSLNGNFATGGDYSVRDGNNVVNHAMRTYNCYLTDGQYAAGADVGTDATEDLYVLNWNGDTKYYPTCVLIVDD